ncbi:MAG: chromosomal replication initiator protein DnaA [Planctomycetota bacterium]
MIQSYSDTALLCEAALREIAARISDEQFLTWFQRVRFSHDGPDRIAVHVPNRFCLTFLKHRFLATIQEALEVVTQLQQPRIEFVVADDHESSVSRGNEFAAGAPAASHNLNSASPRSTRVLDHPDAIPLNPDYTFDQFVTGPSNRLAHAAAIAVAQKPGGSYNPLFIYGAVGLGKTHLIQAVAHTLLDQGMSRLVYISCASFTNDFISALDRNALDGFRARYREADALLIDDVQFLANKERTQEEFFHTFNAIYNLQKQVFLTSDSLPSEISGLGERLVSRFKLGLVAQLAPPALETRVAILIRKGRKLGLEISQDVGEYVAQRVRENVREIEGAVLRLHSLVTIERRPLNIESVRDSLADLLEELPQRIDMAKILQSVLEEFGVQPGELHSRKRNRSVVLPRQVCMYLARQLTGHSLGEIGSYFGDRDHSTVLHSIDKIATAMSSDAHLRVRIQSLEERLKR